MSSGHTSVDTSGMKLALNDFENALQQVNTAYSDMSEQQSTLAANWTGEAASTFGQALTQYLEDLSKVQSALRTMTETLEQNTGVYVNTNEGSSQLAQVFATGLPGLTGI
jgi:WXG100 family type VII secretion target